MEDNYEDALNDDYLNLDLSKRTEEEILYLISMGMIKLEEVPEERRTVPICQEALRIDEGAAYHIPPEVMERLPEHDRETCEACLEKKSEKEEKARTEEKQKEDQKRENDRSAERYYRETTGDYDHDGDVDIHDKVLQKSGLGEIDI